MKPSKATQGTQRDAGETPPAVSLCVTLKERKDFLACNRGPYRSVRGFILQARNRQDDDPTIRIGYSNSVSASCNSCYTRRSC